MQIHLTIAVSDGNHTEFMTKTVKSNVRPAKGDIIDDPGFDGGFHNGYEVVKVTINYETDECYVSLTPLAPELQTISMESYIQKLGKHGWTKVTKEK